MAQAQIRKDNANAAVTCTKSKVTPAGGVVTRLVRLSATGLSHITLEGISRLITAYGRYGH